MNNNSINIVNLQCKEKIFFSYKTNISAKNIKNLHIFSFCVHF